MPFSSPAASSVRSSCISPQLPRTLLLPFSAVLSEFASFDIFLPSSTTSFSCALSSPALFCESLWASFTLFSKLVIFSPSGVSKSSSDSLLFFEKFALFSSNILFARFANSKFSSFFTFFKFSSCDLRIFSLASISLFNATIARFSSFSLSFDLFSSSSFASSSFCKFKDSDFAISAIFVWLPSSSFRRLSSRSSSSSFSSFCLSEILYSSKFLASSFILSLFASSFALCSIFSRSLSFNSSCKFSKASLCFAFFKFAFIKKATNTTQTSARAAIKIYKFSIVSTEISF